MIVHVADCKAELIARCLRTGHSVSLGEEYISGTIVCKSCHDIRFPFCCPYEEDFYTSPRVQLSAFGGPPAMSFSMETGETWWIDWEFLGKWVRINRGFRLLQRTWRLRRLTPLLPFDTAVVARIVSRM